MHFLHAMSLPFNEQLRAARLAADLSQSAASALADVSLRAFQQWESGQVEPHRYIQTGILADLGATPRPNEKPEPINPEHALSAQPPPKTTQIVHTPAPPPLKPDLFPPRVRAPLTKPSGKVL
jgi:transcriptional regulator with XRE-family HTH domain